VCRPLAGPHAEEREFSGRSHWQERSHAPYYELVKTRFSDNIPWADLLDHSPWALVVACGRRPRRALSSAAIWATAAWVLSTCAGAVETAAGAAPARSDLFRLQYSVLDRSFCYAQCCVDFDADGKREILFSSRKTGQLQMLNAADGAVRWSKTLEGQQQSISAFDIDGDGAYEIIYTVSGPGRLYVLDRTGRVLKQWDADDGKLGNSPVILDGDGDGVPDGYLGSRRKYLLRLDMQELTLIKRRTPWVQCGCHITAMDVDRDGRWDLFAGSGDDLAAGGVLHRFDPVSLASLWSYRTGDNASSADPVLADIDGDREVEIVKSVDNYAGNDAHDAVYAFETDGTLLWKVEGLSGEDSPNVADLDGDGEVEIVGMTFGSEVYCLDAEGRIKWRKDLRPQLDDRAHAYMTPVLCDLDGDARLEILAMTNGGYPQQANGILFALSAEGHLLDRLDVGGPRFWGEASYCNVDDDPQMELLLSGSGGLDVIETNGLGPNTESFQRRRNYQRLNVVPWAYEDSYFIYRGKKAGLRNLTDNLVLEKASRRYLSAGRFTTELLTLPPGCFFDRVDYRADEPAGTALWLNVLSDKGRPILRNLASGRDLDLRQPLRLEFVFSTSDGSATPLLDSYRLSFDRLPGTGGPSVPEATQPGSLAIRAAPPRGSDSVALRGQPSLSERIRTQSEDRLPPPATSTSVVRRSTPRRPTIEAMRRARLSRTERANSADVW